MLVYKYQPRDIYEETLTAKWQVMRLEQKNAAKIERLMIATEGKLNARSEKYFNLDCCVNGLVCVVSSKYIIVTDNFP